MNGIVDDKAKPRIIDDKVNNITFKNLGTYYNKLKLDINPKLNGITIVSTLCMWSKDFNKTKWKYTNFKSYDDLSKFIYSQNQIWLFTVDLFKIGHDTVKFNRIRVTL